MSGDVTHTYVSIGTISIKVTVTDADGRILIGTLNVSCSA
jgi:hypothetical protein